MFIAGLRRIDRVRGDGWLDCPGCHEHALQEVVDEIRFAALGFYRFFPVSRHRYLVCKRCGHKRRASAEEMRNLRTVGRGVGRAVMAPIGLMPFLIAGVVVLALATRSATSDSGISYNDLTLQPIAPASMKVPSNYNHSYIDSQDPSTAPIYVASDPTGVLIIRLRHYVVDDTPANILASHFSEDAGLTSNGFPDQPPKGDTVKVAGTDDAIRVTVSYLQSNQKAVITFYAFNKDGNGYILSFQQLGTNGVNEADKVESTVRDSLSFNQKQTPAPTPSPSPGASPSAGSSTTTTTTTTGSSSSSS